MMFMISVLPAKQATGYPFPRDFAKVARSGVTPNRSWAPPGATRKPVFTSSRIRRIPWSEHNWRRCLR